LDGVDVVYHLAWSGLPSSSNENPNAHVALNLAPTLALLEACVKSSVRRIVFLSSGGAVYGQAIELPMTEEHPTRPLSVYGVTKLAVESYLEFYWRQYNLDYVILRPSVPYGESQSTNRGQGAVGVFLRSAITGEPITLWGGRGISRDFFYVGDLAKACLAAANEGVERGAYNIGGGRAITLGQLIDFIEELTNAKLSVMSAPPRNCDPPSILLDITKARRCLGWQPEVGITAGIEHTWAWFKSLQCSEVNTPSPSSSRS
jgi:UDP-glucose 4-epimerase